MENTQIVSVRFYGGDFSGTRGSGDHCFHCGCSCGMSSDNDFTATFTIRES